LAYCFFNCTFAVKLHIEIINEVSLESENGDTCCDKNLRGYIAIKYFAFG